MGKSSYVAILLIASVLAATPFVGIGLSSVGPTWVAMIGSVKRYGDTYLGGWCGVFAQVDSQAEVDTSWVKMQILPIPGNYVFHYARLATALIVKLNYEGKDLYILGTWDVLKVTIVYNSRDETSKVIEPITEGARGELTVTGNWKDFNISIGTPEVETIAGSVIFNRITIRGAIPRGDIRGSNLTPDGRIDIDDLICIAKAFGTVPGMSGYDFSVDLNFDFKIDVDDLRIFANNFGKSY